MYQVLVVEDDIAVRFLYKNMKTWTECGFTIAAEETDGHSAFSRLLREKFDLIFTDIRMPLMDGVELLRKIREHGIITPVVFASSYGDFEYAQQGIKNNLFDYVLKPVDDKKLRPVLMKIKESLDAQSNAQIDGVTSELLNSLGLSAEKDNFVKQIASYCSQHYKDSLTGDDLASVLCLRKDYFGKLFKQHFGISYSDFRTKLKIQYAIELLKTGNYKVYEVCDILGFSSYQFFVEKFKATTGVSPTDYKFNIENK